MKMILFFLLLMASYFFASAQNQTCCREVNKKEDTCCINNYKDYEDCFTKCVDDFLKTNPAICHNNDTDSSCKKSTDDCCCCEEDDENISCYTNTTDTSSDNYKKRSWMTYNSNNKSSYLAKKPKIVIYDFKTKNIAFPDDYQKLKRGDALKIRIVNFNPFVWRLTIDNRDSTHAPISDANNLMSAFLNLSNIGTIVGGISSAAITPLTINNNGGKGNENNRNNIPSVDLFMKTEATKNEFLATNDKNTDSVSKEKFNKLFKSISNETSGINDLFKKTNEKIQTSNQCLQIILRDVDFAKYQIARKFIAERNPYPDCKDFINITNGSLGEDIHRVYNGLRNGIEANLSTLRTDQFAYLNQSADYAQTIRKTPDNINLYVKDSLIRIYYVQMIAAFSKLDSLTSYSSEEPLQESIDRVKGTKLCYTTPPLFLSSDSKIVTLQINPWKDTISYVTDAPITFELPWHQRQIWGVTAGIYGSGLHNDIYSVKDSTFFNTVSGDSASTYSLHKDNTGKGEFGIDALAYYAGRIGNNIYLGGSFGAGISIESNPKPRVLGGISLIIGEKNRISFNAGAIAGFVQRLSSIYENQMSDLSVYPSVVTKDAIKINAFLSINYSF